MGSIAPELRERVDHRRAAGFEEQYEMGVNPHWVRLLKLLRMNVRYKRCCGAELVTNDGRTIMDYLSGYCVHNLGHNHPAIISAIKDELDHRRRVMLQRHVPERVGEPARRGSQESFLLQLRQRGY